MVGGVRLVTRQPVWIKAVPLRQRGSVYASPSGSEEIRHGVRVENTEKACAVGWCVACVNGMRAKIGS